MVKKSFTQVCVNGHLALLTYSKLFLYPSYHFNSDEVSADLQKAKLVRDWPSTITKAVLQSLLEDISSYRGFIQSGSKISTLLTILMNKA